MAAYLATFHLLLRIAYETYMLHAFCDKDHIFHEMLGLRAPFPSPDAPALPCPYVRNSTAVRAPDDAERPRAVPGFGEQQKTSAITSKPTINDHFWSHLSIRCRMRYKEGVSSCSGYCVPQETADPPERSSRARVIVSPSERSLRQGRRRSVGGANPLLHLLARKWLETGKNRVLDLSG